MRAEPRRRRSVWLLSLLAAVAGCVVLPDVVEPSDSEAPWVRILRDQVDPPLLVDGRIQDEVKVDPTNAGFVMTFDANFAVESAGVDGPLTYAWYYGYQPTNLPAVTYSRCVGNPTCPLAVCAFFQSTDLNHNLLLVVSDRPLPTGATAPLAFDAGTTFDWVEWKIELTQDCQ